MNRQAFAHLFNVFGVVNALYAVSMWAITQGGFGLSDLPGLDPKSKITSSLFVIIFIGVLLFITAVCGRNHILTARIEKQPVLPNIGLGEKGTYDPNTWSGRVYQSTIILLFVALPLGSLYHLNRVVADRGIIWNEELPAGAALTTACFMPSLWPFGRCEEAKLDDGATVLATAKNSNDITDNGLVQFDNRTMSRLWLTNHWCDVYWAREMAGPQVAVRNNCATSDKGLSASEARSRLALSIFGEPIAKSILSFADNRRGLPPVCEPSYAASACTGYSNRSENCKDDGNGCRGVEWIRVVSPALIIVPSIAGLLGALSFFLALFFNLSGLEWITWIRRAHKAGTNG